MENGMKNQNKVKINKIILKENKRRTQENEALAETTDNAKMTNNAIYTKTGSAKVYNQKKIIIITYLKKTYDCLTCLMNLNSLKYNIVGQVQS